MPWHEAEQGFWINHGLRDPDWTKLVQGRYAHTVTSVPLAMGSNSPPSAHPRPPRARALLGTTVLRSACRSPSRRTCRRPLGLCFHLSCTVGCLCCLPLSHRPSLGLLRRSSNVAGGHHFPKALHRVRREVAVCVLEGHHVVKHSVVKAAGWRLPVPGAPPGLVLAPVELQKVVHRRLQFGSGRTCQWGRRNTRTRTRTNTTPYGTEASAAG